MLFLAEGCRFLLHRELLSVKKSGGIKYNDGAKFTKCLQCVLAAEKGLLHTQKLSKFACVYTQASRAVRFTQV